MPRFRYFGFTNVRLWSAPDEARVFRLGLVSATLVTGLLLATVTLPAADHLQDNVTGSVGVDVR